MVPRLPKNKKKKKALKRKKAGVSQHPIRLHYFSAGNDNSHFVNNNKNSAKKTIEEPIDYSMILEYDISVNNSRYGEKSKNSSSNSGANNKNEKNNQKGKNDYILEMAKEMDEKIAKEEENRKNKKQQQPEEHNKNQRHKRKK